MKVLKKDTELRCFVSLPTFICQSFLLTTYFLDYLIIYKTLFIKKKSERYISFYFYINNNKFNLHKSSYNYCLFSYCNSCLNTIFINNICNSLHEQNNTTVKKFLLFFIKQQDKLCI
jgi:hypothetical protein